MRNRSIRFYAVDLNQDFGINFGVDAHSFPALIFYPAYHKATNAVKYSNDINGIKMAKFIHQNADIKFELKKKFFTPPKDPMDGAVMMDIGADGSINPTPEDIAKL